ncbi:hypothetical protein OUZ56_032316 [Daphnia magna]|uniref:Uncharacterized protein n=1 Tax=Daphnia magna TaxID=35525 RepID=A0ABR0B906_9CRUS|nr:hypothetical protein OUZ56_032316 [Daphnia magna]
MSPRAGINPGSAAVAPIIGRPGRMCSARRSAAVFGPAGGAKVEWDGSCSALASATAVQSAEARVGGALSRSPPPFAAGSVGGVLPRGAVNCRIARSIRRRDRERRPFGRTEAGGAGERRAEGGALEEPDAGDVVSGPHDDRLGAPEDPFEAERLGGHDFSRRHLHPAFPFAGEHGAEAKRYVPLEGADGPFQRNEHPRPRELSQRPRAPFATIVASKFDVAEHAGRPEKAGADVALFKHATKRLFEDRPPFQPQKLGIHCSFPASLAPGGAGWSVG